VKKLIPGDGANGDNFGCSVSIGNNYAVVGSRWDDDNGSESGSVYIYHNNNGAWEEKSKIIAGDGQGNDFFGNSVSINRNYKSDDYIVVGAYGDDDNGTASGSVYFIKY